MSTMSSDDSSLILHPVRLLLEGAPAADAADTVVEKWGKYVVQLLNGLKNRRPEFLSLPEVVSVVNLLQTLADVRLRIDWLAWGGDWLPGTVIEQCLSQLPVAATNDYTPSSPASFRRSSAAAASHVPTQSSLYQAPISPRVIAAKAIAPAPVPTTCSVKRATPNEASSSCIRPTKRAHIATFASTPESTKDGSLKDQLDTHLLREPHKVLYKCSVCENRRTPGKPCLTVTKKGVMQNRCVWCIIGHKKCEWKEGHLKENQVYRGDSNSFYDVVGAAGPSEGFSSGTTFASVPPARTRVVVSIPKRPVASIRTPYGPKSAIKRWSSVTDTMKSLSEGAGDSQPVKNETKIDASGSSSSALAADAARVHHLHHTALLNTLPARKIVNEEPREGSK